MAQKAEGTGTPYQTNGSTVKAPRPEKSGNHATVKRGEDLRIKGNKK